MAGNLARHPAPGLGDMMPGWYAVPQNPITSGGTAPQPVTVKSSIGDILRGQYAVPQNPIVSQVTGNVRPLATGMGMGCACGQLNGQPVGMGDFTTDWSKVSTDFSAGNYSTVLQDTLLGIPVWGYAVGIVAAMMLSGGSSGRRRR